MNKRISLFDSVKGIAIVGIMFIHLGQWCVSVPNNSRIAIIRSAGLFGVELTYLVNAFFYAKNYKEKKIHGGG